MPSWKPRNRPSPRQRRLAGNPLGVTAAPFIRSGTAAVVDLAERAERLGYDSFWVAEVTGIEAFSVLGAASRAAPGVGLGTGVLAMQVRTPPLLAMAAASLQALAPDREILLGVGVSSPVVACDWHGARYPASPLAHMREFLALLRECLSGDTITFTGDYYQVRKFRLGVELGDRKPKIVLGALGRVLRLAGAEADGVLLDYLPASHVSWCVDAGPARGRRDGLRQHSRRRRRPGRCRPSRPGRSGIDTPGCDSPAGTRCARDSGLVPSPPPGFPRETSRPHRRAALTRPPGGSTAGASRICIECMARYCVSSRVAGTRRRR